MKLKIVIILLILFGCLFSEQQEIGTSEPITRYFSPIIRTEVIDVQEFIYSYKLRSEDLIVNSETVKQDTLLLVSGVDFQIDYSYGMITFNKEEMSLILERETYIEIEYAIIPPRLISRYSLFQVREYSDSLSIDTIAKPGIRLRIPDTNLNISGSKTFGVSIGSDEDFNINQALFLQIDGELRKNLRIQAQLSDSQSPFTPEGDTKELSSIDRIFIRLYGDTKDTRSNKQDSDLNEYEIVFGDIELAFENTQFMNHWSKFEGVKAEWHGRNTYKGALALSRGKQTTAEIFGLDGKQGPYFIHLSETGAYLQIIAGSEDVYLNGIRMNRGEDYRINYSEGSITFTQRHFIDGNSRIYIRFQYSDEEYRQHKYLLGNRIMVSDKLAAGVHMIIQSDDHNNPLREHLSAEDHAALREAGDDTAWTDGVIKVEENEGSYEKIIDGDEIYYRYVGLNQGNYIIHFSYVGEGKGDYERTTPSKFTYNGYGMGSWIPKRRLPSPEYMANYDMSLKWSGDFWSLKGEGVFSKYDRNTFSPLDNEDNDGYATHIELQLTPDYDKYNPNLSFYHRYLSKNLTLFADIRDPELNYAFLYTSPVDSLDVSEFGTQFSVNQQKYWRSSIRYFRKEGTLKSYDTSFLNNNIMFNISLMPERYFPSVDYSYRYYDSEFKQTEPADTTISHFHNNLLTVSQSLSYLKLTADYRFRKYNKKSDEEVGERYTFGRIALSSQKLRRLAFNIFVSKDEDEDYEQRWNKRRGSTTVGGESYLDTHGQRLRARYSHRQVTTYPDKQESIYDMAEINYNSSLLNRGLNLVSNYSLVNTEFYPRIRELVYVGRGLGIYDSTGVFAEDGDYEYINVPVGEPEMSIEINADLNIYFTPRLFLVSQNDNDDKVDSLSRNWLRRVQTESYFLISENSRAENKWDAYLLKPSVLMSEENTIYGRFMNRQVIWLDLMQRRLLLKYMFRNDKSLDNRYSEDVKTNINVNELMFRISRFMSSDFELTIENRKEEESRYQSDVRVNNYSLDIRNRPNNNINISTLIRYSDERGDRQEGGYDYTIKSLTLAETVSFFFQSKYRLFARMEYRHNSRDGSGYLAFLPEKRDGDMFRWNFRLNYQVNPYTTASFDYAGNKYPQQNSVHTMKIDFRAEF